MTGAFGPSLERNSTVSDGYVFDVFFDYG